MDVQQPLALLGGLSPAQFMRRHWHKKPLLVRQAIAGFKPLLARAELLELAGREGVESRFIQDKGGQWVLRHGPLARRSLPPLSTPRWTALVQGVDLHHEAVHALMQQFRFVPEARLDDLMISYATDGGGVGPHFDNYDVFLLQGTGRRRWQIADQADRSLIEDAPLRILKNFQPSADWVLEPGDMLYLPPHWAHNGTAMGECTTYSIGFRSPSAQELGTEFLAWMQERIELEGIYADPDLTLQQNSAEIGTRMVEQIETMLAAIRWGREDVKAFVGAYLSEPKSHIFFDPPQQALSMKAFARAVRSSGFVLDARSLLLFCGEDFYLNGEALALPSTLHALIASLAHQRGLPATSLSDCPDELLELLHEWYENGFGAPAQSSKQ